MPATLGLIGGFVALSMWLDVRMKDAGIGFALGFFVLIVCAAVLIRVLPTK